MPATFTLEGSKKIDRCEAFGGEGSEALNALMTAFWVAAGGEDEMYSWLDKTPKTTLVVFLYEALQKIGYDITPNSSKERV